MAISKEVVDYVAHLARIELEPQELEKLSGQLNDILKFIDKLAALDTQNIPPASHILPLSNILREDNLRASLKIEQVTENAPQKSGNFFVVPKVIE
jgi:aspartyl-tRNA(Asn)/glutamyl-tRNA(Gln) amidotransferase subunit C